MDSLLLCDACNHGAVSHDRSGCDSDACPCVTTREEIIAVGIEAAREEIRTLWGLSATVASPSASPSP